MNSTEITAALDKYLELFNSGKISGLELAELILKVTAKGVK
jgi:hypothetical protein